MVEAHQVLARNQEKQIQNYETGREIKETMLYQMIQMCISAHWHKETTRARVERENEDFYRLLP